MIQAGYDPIFKPEEYQETCTIIGYKKIKSVTEEKLRNY
jgi:inosine/xanthosine triphosphate pyrophosphatase family protein